MALPKVKVKFLNEITYDEFQLMNKLNSALAINIVDVFITKSAAIVTLGSHNEIDSLLHPDIARKLAENNLQIIPSPMHKSERTVFVAKVRHFISNSPSEKLIQQINVSNSGKFEAIEVNIVPSTQHTEGMRRNLKVTFSSVDQAATARADGFYIGDLKINPDSVFKEDFVEIKQCFRCFKYTHYTNQCKVPHPICSICAGQHSFRNCIDKENLHCCNCEGNHVAISASCPIRRNIVKNLKEARHQSNDEPNNLKFQTSINNHPPAVNSNINPPQDPINNQASANNPPINSTPSFPSLPVPNPINAPWASVFYNPKLYKKRGNNNQQAPKPVNPPSNPSNPTPSPPPINANQSSILPALVEVWKSIASRIAGNDHALYIKILNSYFVENGYPGFKTPQLVFDAINKSPVIPSSPKPTPTIPIPPPIPQPLPSLNPNPTIPPPKPLSLINEDNVEDANTISNNEIDESVISNTDTDSENESNQSNTDNETTVTESSQTDLNKYSPMTLRSHPKIKKHTLSEIGSRSQSRDQSPELPSFPPHHNIKHYNSTNSLYNEKGNTQRNRHDEEVTIRPEVEQALKNCAQQLKQFKKKNKKKKRNN